MAKRKKTLRDTAVALVLKQAVEEISHLTFKTTYVEVQRAKGKRHRLSPTALQVSLLQYVGRAGPFSFHQTLGMDWRFLGGLLARGLLYWDTISGGEVLLKVSQKGEDLRATKTSAA